MVRRRPHLFFVCPMVSDPATIASDGPCAWTSRCFWVSSMRFSRASIELQDLLEHALFCLFRDGAGAASLDGSPRCADGVETLNPKPLPPRGSSSLARVTVPGAASGPLGSLHCPAIHVVSRGWLFLAGNIQYVAGRRAAPMVMDMPFVQAHWPTLLLWYARDCTCDLTASQHGSPASACLDAWRSAAAEGQCGAVVAVIAAGQEGAVFRV
jgi:hypothetical protein